MQRDSKKGANFLRVRKVSDSVFFGPRYNVEVWRMCSTHSCIGFSEAKGVSQKGLEDLLEHWGAQNVTQQP